MSLIDEDRFFVGSLRIYQKNKDLSGLALIKNFSDYFASIERTILFEYISSEEVDNTVNKYYEKKIQQDTGNIYIMKVFVFLENKLLNIISKHIN